MSQQIQFPVETPTFKLILSYKRNVANIGNGSLTCTKVFEIKNSPQLSENYIIAKTLIKDQTTTRFDLYSRT
jgi:hypothetical protein